MTPDVWLWDSKGLLVQRRSWEPQFALLVEGPHEVAGVTVWRAVPCSVEGTWPDEYFANDEIEITTVAHGEWVAHLWAEHPVAESHCPQLTRFVAALDKISLENLAVARSAIAEGLPLSTDERSGMILDPKEDAEALLTRERLLYGVNWRACTVDSLIADKLHRVARLPKGIEHFDKIEAWKERRALGLVGLAEPQQPPPHVELRVPIVGRKLVLWLFSQTDGVNCEIWVLPTESVTGERSKQLDGARISPHAGEPVTIENGRAICPLSTIAKGFALSTIDGTPLTLGDGV